MTSLADSSIDSKNLVMEEIFIKGYEKVIKVTDKLVGLKAIISIHNTSLGPAMGGTRIYPYKTFEEALKDVLRLSRGMTYKSAVAEVGFGGGKSVIIADPKKDKTNELLYSFGKAVDSLKGKYICAEDVGCGMKDVMQIRKATRYITGLNHDKSSGDPSPYTAWGVFKGIQSVLKKIYGSSSMEGKKINLQGLGSVGGHLASLLFWHGADLSVFDINEEVLNKVAQKYRVKVVSSKEIIEGECDVFSPCAMGGVINDETINKFRCKAIAGSSNNQLMLDSHGEMLHEKGILFAPDFVINGGGLINVSSELEKNGYNPKNTRSDTNKIFDILMSIFEIAEKNNISTSKAAIELAEYKVKYNLGKRIEKTYFHHSI